MRKVMFVFFALLAISMMAMPAYAQGGNAAASGGANWVAISSGFGIAIAAGLAGLGQGRVGAAACEAMARTLPPSSDSVGPDSGPGLHRVAGAVYAGYHLRQGSLVLPCSNLRRPILGWGVLLCWPIFGWDVLGCDRIRNQNHGRLTRLRKRGEGLRVDVVSPAVRALDGFTLSLERGEIFGFLGPNGAGKTTAIHLALGFMRPSSGAGESWASRSAMQPPGPAWDFWRRMSRCIIARRSNSYASQRCAEWHAS